MLLIKNTKVVDGLGGPMRQADVLVSGNIISAIGHFPNKKTDTMIDGLGMYVCPGFIEPHTHADHTLNLFTHPEQSTYRKQGITTLIGGNNSLSLAPLLYGSLESIEHWANPHAINVNWHTVNELIRTINNLPLGINFGTLLGYETVRRAIAHTPHHDLTDKEWRVTEHLLEKALHEGALGISTHLTTEKSHGISSRELKGLAQICSREGKPLVLHARPESNTYMACATHIITLYKKTGATIIIKDFAPREASAAETKEFILAYETIKNIGDNLYLEFSFAENQEIPLKDLIPHNKELKNPSYRKQIIKSLPRIPHARIIQAPRAYERLIGKTLEKYALSRETSLKEAILALMECTEGNAVLEVPQEINMKLMQEVINHPQTLISGIPRTFFKAADRARWALETTIARLTAHTARAYTLEKRGVITENSIADLIIMNSRSEIIHTIINGSLTAHAGLCIKK